MTDFKERLKDGPLSARNERSVRELIRYKPIGGADSEQPRAAQSGLEHRRDLRRTGGTFDAPKGPANDSERQRTTANDSERQF